MPKKVFETKPLTFHDMLDSMKLLVSKSVPRGKTMIINPDDFKASYEFAPVDSAFPKVFIDECRDKYWSKGECELIDRLSGNWVKHTWVDDRKKIAQKVKKYRRISLARLK